MTILVIATVAICLVLIDLRNKLREIIQIFKRVESRLALNMPSEIEARSFKDDWHTEFEVQQRAMHPDVWIAEWTKRISSLEPGTQKDEWTHHREDEKRFRR